MKHRKFLGIFVLAITLLLACNSKHENELKETLRLSDSLPDSALTVLQKMRGQSFTERDSALYALSYTKAQCKIGLDMKDDSLLHVAKDYFTNQPQDSLYGYCMFYVGSYYVDVDSLEQAVFYLNKSLSAMVQLKDTAYICLSCERLAKCLRATNTEKALVYSKRARDLYRQYRQSNVSNYIYYGLGYSICLLMDGQYKQAFDEGNKYIDLALKDGDSAVIADVYQHLSLISNDRGHTAEAALYLEKAMQYKRKPDLSLLFNIVLTYINIGKYDECKYILDTLRVTTYSENCTLYTMRRNLAIKQKDWGQAECYADTAKWYYEQQHHKVCRDREAYYAEKMLQQEDKLKALYDLKGQKQQMSFMLLSIVFLCVLVAVVYYNHRNKIRLQLKHSAEKVANNEAQMTLMRQFLLQKSEIITQLQDIQHSTINHFTLQEKDWKELELFLNTTQNQFVKRLRDAHSHLSENDLHLLMLLRLDIPSKSLATIYGISEKSIRQNLYLFKKKVGLEKEKYSIREYIRNF